MNRLFAQFLIAATLISLIQSKTEVKFEIKGQPADRILATDINKAFSCVKSAFNKGDKTTYDPAKDNIINLGACSLKFSAMKDADLTIQIEMSGADNVSLTLKKYDFKDDTLTDPDCKFVTEDYIAPYKTKCDKIISGKELTDAYKTALLKIKYKGGPLFTQQGTDMLFTNKAEEVVIFAKIEASEKGEGSLHFMSSFFSNSIIMVSATQEAVDKELNDAFQIFAEDAIIMNNFMANKSENKAETKKCEKIKEYFKTFVGDADKDIVYECVDDANFNIVQVAIKTPDVTDIAKMFGYQKIAIMNSSLYDTSKIIEMICVTLKRDRRNIFQKTSLLAVD